PVHAHLECRRPTAYPTRRSSDLVERHELDRGDPEAREVLETRRHPAVRALGREGSDVQLVEDGARPGRSAPVLVVPGEAPRVDKDRKSTRLNSSHLGISYAVFCL